MCRSFLPVSTSTQRASTEMLRGAEALSCALSTRRDRGKGMTLTTKGREEGGGEGKEQQQLSMMHVRAV